MTVARVLVLWALVSVRVAHAGACDAAEVEELRAHLTAQASKANTWNWTWRLTFTGAAVATAAVGAWNPAPSLQHGLYASAGKASVGALARFILPLSIHVPDATGDACTDLAALRKELRKVARRERSLFWTSHVGGALVNLAGAAYVYHYDGTGKALLSVAIGYPVGLLSNYTMPRGSWKLWREREATWNLAAVTAIPRGDGWVFSVSGTF